VERWDKEKSGMHVYMGGVELCPKDIFVDKKNTFELKNEKKGKAAGTLSLIQVNLVEKPNFVDFLRGGEQLNMVVAIDFTGSNGAPTQPTSLHEVRNDGTLNQYQSAIVEVCDILLNYDYDKRVPVWGFGAKTNLKGMDLFEFLSEETVVNHCFSLSGNPENPEVFGLQGILEAYVNTLIRVELSGPKFFQHIIRSAMDIAKANEVKNIYTVLLILTDGETNDMPETRDLILKSNDIPLSIIIIGVGNDEFSELYNIIVG
jgi:hypothetical protein